MTNKNNILDKHLLEKEFEYQDDLYVQERLFSMFLDHVIHSFILIPIVIVLELVFKQIESSNQFDIFVMVIFSIYYCKDIILGKSLAKRILGQTVIDCRSKLPVKPIRSVLRNITIPLWPVEVVVVIFSPKRRIGDFISNTKVVRINKENPLDIYKESKKIDRTEILLAIVIAIIAGYGAIFITGFMANILFLIPSIIQ